MEYLLYYKDGFIKKFPLDKEVVCIGRGSDNDLVLPEDYVSRHHAQIVRQGEQYLLRDLGSRNRTWMNGAPVAEAVLNLDDCFNIKDLEFCLKSGDLDEFQADPRIVPLFKKIARESQREHAVNETKYIRDIYGEFPKRLLQNGIRGRSWSALFAEFSTLFFPRREFGSLFILRGTKGEWEIAYCLKKHADALGRLRAVMGERDVFAAASMALPTEPKERHGYYSVPFSLAANRPAAIVYLWAQASEKEQARIRDFLVTMAKVLELLGRITFGPEAGAGTAKRVEDNGAEEAIVTQNPLMLKLIKQTRKIAAADIFVLVQGESGTGKELIARLIHDSSPRKAGPYLAINCAAIPETLLESELFGHEKGAFTGALQTKKGKLELASGGTLVLDEVSDMPMNLQAKLLRALEEHAFYRVGGMQPIQVDLRIISLTNANLKARINEGRFREDLYYRLVHHTITLPALRDRSEDVIPLIFHFAEQCCRKLQREIKGFSPGAIELLLNYPWPGNIRQLRNEIRRLANLAESGQLIGADLLSEDIASYGLARRERATRPGGDGLQTEKQKIIALLERNQWNQSQTAREIGISFQGLYKKLKKLGISRPQANPPARAPESESGEQ